MGRRRGLEDSKNGGMFDELMRFVVAKRPWIVVLENVKGLMSQKKGESFGYILSRLKEEGYIVQHDVLKLQELGIPQTRQRVFIVGIRRDVQKECEHADMFDLSEHSRESNLSSFLKVPMQRSFAPEESHMCWDKYWTKDRSLYTLSLRDAIRLQGFQGFQFEGKENEIWGLLGNTIPTIFTRIIALRLDKIFRVGSIRDRNPVVEIDTMNYRDVMEMVRLADGVHVTAAVSSLMGK